MLDTVSCRAEGGSLDVRVYRKKTHTDQYLDFKSNHPLHHKLGVVCTLLDRNDAITTKESDKVKEREHVRNALSNVVKLWLSQVGDRESEEATHADQGER